MLPEWMTTSENYAPPKDGGAFAVKTIKAIGQAMGRIRLQAGHEKKLHIPAILKLVGLVVAIVIISVTQQRLVIMAAAAILLAYLAMWPARDLVPILKASLAAGLIGLIIMLPAMLMNRAGLNNNLLVVVKIMLSITLVNIFNHTTQWNHITGALRRLHVPATFVFILDITLKYIVLLGRLITDLLTAMQLRAVGHDDSKYTSVGGVMGVTFLRGAEMNTQMYEAMRCRGFTDDYSGL